MGPQRRSARPNLRNLWIWNIAQWPFHVIKLKTLKWGDYTDYLGGGGGGV